jgi:hypothetical protein
LKRPVDEQPRCGPGRPLPLFPLQLVLFPGALLSLRVFEARYLDLIGECLRRQMPFGVICLRQGAEAGASAKRCNWKTWACWPNWTRSTPNSRHPARALHRWAALSPAGDPRSATTACGNAPPS